MVCMALHSTPILLTMGSFTSNGTLDPMKLRSPDLLPMRPKLLSYSRLKSITSPSPRAASFTTAVHPFLVRMVSFTSLLVTAFRSLKTLFLTILLPTWPSSTEKFLESMSIMFLKAQYMASHRIILLLIILVFYPRSTLMVWEILGLLSMINQRK